MKILRKAFASSTTVQLAVDIMVKLMYILCTKI